MDVRGKSLAHYVRIPLMVVPASLHKENDVYMVLAIEWSADVVARIPTSSGSLTGREEW